MDIVAFKQRITEIYAQLDAYTYYELLKVKSTADSKRIRESFHRMALSMHPDRYRSYADPQLQDMIYAIYKRITEGYQVLMDARTRQTYDDALPKGQRRLLAERKRKLTGPTRPEQSIADPQAKRFFLLGRDAEMRGDLKNARINYKFAVDLIGEHSAILARIAALDAAEKKS
ncbi:MAG: DnaJ domain-containing protein [Pseudomonadota bacterium]